MLPIERLRCEWCEMQNPTGATTCQGCGASLDVKNLVSDSGWREAPRLRDRTEIRYGYGNVFERRLAAGESILVEPGAFLYKDATVTMQVVPQRLSLGLFSGLGMNLARMTGPGRLGIQSMYYHHATE